jgi:hypothetical protein
MQVAALPESSANKTAAVASKPASSAANDFGSKLAEAMSSSEPITCGKEAGGKKAASKADLKIQPGEHSLQMEKPTADTPSAVANLPLPVQLPPNSLVQVIAAGQLTSEAAGAVADRQSGMEVGAKKGGTAPQVTSSSNSAADIGQEDSPLPALAASGAASEGVISETRQQGINTTVGVFQGDPTGRIFAAKLPVNAAGSSAESGSAGKAPRLAAPAEPTSDSRESAEKKGSASNQSNTVPAHEVSAPATFPKGVDTTVVAPAEAASAPPAQTKAPETRDARKTQQMLDSTPVLPSAPPAGRITAEGGGDVQMHVGIRTAVFGAVEIHTTVHQNQVGLTINGERGLAHWFSTEVQHIESGLKDHHLNLTTVELDGGRTGLQTATGSHHQQPQRNFSRMLGSRSGAPLEPAGEPEPIAVVTPDLPAWSGKARVSIRI